MTDQFFALCWCLCVILRVDVSPVAGNLLDGVTILPFSRKHCTLPISLEMGKINNKLQYFPSYMFTGNVLRTTATRNGISETKNFLGEHVRRSHCA